MLAIGYESVTIVVAVVVVVERKQNGNDVMICGLGSFL